MAKAKSPSADPFAKERHLARWFLEDQPQTLADLASILESRVQEKLGEHHDIHSRGGVDDWPDRENDDSTSGLAWLLKDTIESIDFGKAAELVIEQLRKPKTKKPKVSKTKAKRATSGKAVANV